MDEPSDPKDAPPMPPSSVNPAPPPNPALDNAAVPISDAEKERRRAESAEGQLRQQELLRNEMDRQLKAILNQLKREKAERDNEEEKSHARGRIDALEERLDEMHHTWSELLKQAITRGGPTPPTPPGTAPAGDELRAVRSSLARVLTEMERLGASISARIGESDRHVAVELEKYDLKLTNLAQERAALQAAMEEERHRLRQEFTKERMADESKAHAQWEEIKKALLIIQDAQRATTQDTASIKELTGKLEGTVNRPEKAKDLMMLDMEQEKRDLKAALKARGEELRAHADERREVERSMGESLLALNRELEAERGKQVEFEKQISDLRIEIQSRDAEIDTLRKSAEEQNRRQQSLAAERDDLGKALMEAIQKAKAQAAAAAQADETWQKQLEEVRRQLLEERNRRAAAESQLADSQAKSQTLTDHIARGIQEKERIENQSAGWTKEREALLETIRKKDEMISMLSATFQNMMKKPGTP